jgi:ferredoxin
MARPRWFVELIKRPFQQRFLLAEMTKLPVFGSLVDHALFQGDDIVYLPIDQVVEVNEEIAWPEEMVLPSQVVEHFVEQANYHWIIDQCLCRDASGCQDYPVELGCLFLGEATLGINPQVGRRVTRDEAHEHLQRCREAGLVHMVGRNKLDTVWLGVGPGDKLLTICNCCPCCCIWRMLPNISPHISTKISRMPGVGVSINGSCQACGLCTQGVCFVDAIHLTDTYAYITEACRGCGRCVSVCPHQAIQLTIEDERFVQTTIDRISAHVDLT